MAGVVTLPQGKAGWWGSDLRVACKELGVPVVGEEGLLREQLDVAFSVNYHKLIKEPLFSHPKKGIVNVHHSYNLRLGGRYSGAWAIMNARKENFWKHGTTLHYIDKELDRGRVIATESFSFGEFETGEGLYRSADDLALRLLKKHLPSILKGTASTTMPEPNQKIYDSHSLEDKRVDLSKPPDEVWDFVRALTFSPWEQPYVQVGSRKFSLFIKREDGND